MYQLDKFELDSQITGNRVYLKKYSLETAKLIFPIIIKEKGRLATFLPWVNRIQTLDDMIEFISKGLVQWKENTSFHYGIYLRDSNAFIGNISLLGINWRTGRVEPGSWVISTYEGQGLIAEAGLLIEGYLFQHGFNKIEIRCSENNIRSAKLAKRAGFKLDGILRDDALEMGELANTLVYSKLKRDFDSE